MTTILIGDVREQLRLLPERSVHCCVTSPPYWGLRSYSTEPQVWGGDPACEHVWLESISIQAGQIYGANAASTLTTGTTQKRREETQSKIGMAINVKTGTCHRCNAWRGELGSEPTIAQFLANMAEVFREVWRVLRDDGICVVNMGDSYAALAIKGDSSTLGGAANSAHASHKKTIPYGLKQQDLCGIPWRLAFALQDAGWYLRSGMPWVKRSPMPESVTDRPTSALEYMFLLTKQPRYYWDAEAVKIDSKTRDTGERPLTTGAAKRESLGELARTTPVGRTCGNGQPTRNFRNADIWFESIRGPHGLCGIGDEMVGIDVTSEAFSESHFATYPRRLIEPFIKAGSSERGCCAECGAPWERVVKSVDTGKTQKMPDGFQTGSGAHGTIHRNGREKGEAGKPVMASITTGWAPTCTCPDNTPVPATILDPFLGSGTTLLVAKALGRNGIGIELSPTYAQMAKRRIKRGYDPAPQAEVSAGQLGLFT